MGTCIWYIAIHWYIQWGWNVMKALIFDTSYLRGDKVTWEGVGWQCLASIERVLRLSGPQEGPPFTPRQEHHIFTFSFDFSSFWFLIYFSLLRGFWGSVARGKGIIMKSRRGNYHSYQTKMFDTCPQFHVILRSFITIACKAWIEGKEVLIRHLDE